MLLARCTWDTWERTGSSCDRPAEVHRQIPGRERLRTYPVCRWHSAMIDVGNVGGHLTEDFARTSRLLIAEAEAITRRAARRPGG